MRMVKCNGQEYNTTDGKSDILKIELYLVIYELDVIYLEYSNHYASLNRSIHLNGICYSKLFKVNL
jgi:hypothetical protein